MCYNVRMRCTECAKEFWKIGMSPRCPTCRLMENRTTRSEREVEANRWMEKVVGQKVNWLAPRYAKERRYDGVLFVPGVGTIRVGLGRLDKECEMSIAVGEKLMGSGPVHMRFNCARTAPGVRKVWKKTGNDEAAQMPGECGCRGCVIKRYIEGRVA